MRSRRPRRQHSILDGALTVVVFDSLIERISETLASSAIEEGGKLLGRITTSGGRTTISAESYLDAGPNVKHSSSHIMPDGEYQEALFRVIERYDPSIDHIGSWHSHHCNGLEHLSGGDISGYESNVNNQNYLHDIFLAILVTSLSARGPSLRYYLFARHASTYSEISPDDVQVVRDRYSHDSFLLEAERTSRRLDPAATPASAPALPQRPAPADGRDSLRELRLEDDRWVREQEFDSVALLRDKRDDTVTWRWTIIDDKATLAVRYSHPRPDASGLSPDGRLVVRDQGGIVTEHPIRLDNNRHAIIIEALQKAIRSARRHADSPHHSKE